MAKRVVKKVVKAPIISRSFSNSELQALTKQEIISELIKSPHGMLADYRNVGEFAAKQDADFFAHLIVWNHFKGSIRDAKKALPLIALTGTKDAEYQENALALLADLDPRNFTKALRFSRELKVPQRVLRRLVERYLRDLESNKRQFGFVASRHTPSLRELYAKYHVKPEEFANGQIFGSVLTPERAALARLKMVGDAEAAGLIGKFKLPYLQLRSALGDRFKSPDILVAVIQRMSPSELVNNMKSLEKAGVMNVPAARAALEAALGNAAAPKKGKLSASLLKATKAAEQFEEDSVVGQKLKQLQEKQIESSGGIDGNWLVLADKSTSMAEAIEVAKETAATISRLVKGKVYLVYQDTIPRFFDVTGKTLDAIKKETRGITATGATSLGTGLVNVTDRKLQIDGIALISDGAENTAPSFATAYQGYVKKLGNEPTVYWYRTKDDNHHLSPSWIQGFQSSCKSANIDVQEFDLRRGADYYSLPNLIQTMRVGRYGLLDEILSTELVTLDQVLDNTKQMPVLVRSLQVA